MTFNQGVGGSIPPCLRREKRLKLSSYRGLSLFCIFAFSPDFDDFGENNRLDETLKHYAKHKVLIIDEIVYLPTGLEEANLL